MAAVEIFYWLKDRIRITDENLIAIRWTYVTSSSTVGFEGGFNCPSLNCMQHTNILYTQTAKTYMYTSITHSLKKINMTENECSFLR